MNPTYHVNQVAESQPDADDSIVPISTLRRFSETRQKRRASWKLGKSAVNKQGDKSCLHTNLCREALWSASQVMDRLMYGEAKTTKNALTGLGNPLIMRHWWTSHQGPIVYSVAHEH